MAELKFFDLIDKASQALRAGDMEGGVNLLNEYPEQAALRQYFFDKLEGVEWLKPLSEKGFFRKPPAPERDEEKGTIVIPLWPESQYLARVASQSPELVSDVILNIPETDNVRIYEDLADAALEMPPEISAKLVEKAKIWAQSPYKHLLAEKLGDLVRRFASAGMAKEALDLARIVLDVIPDPRRRKKAEGDERFDLPPEPTARIDQSDYESILKKDVPDLVTTGGALALDFLCDLLEKAVELSQRSGKAGAPEDHSWIWRPAIEDHPRNRDHGIKDSILTSLRDACQAIILNDGRQIDEVVSKLESRPWRIFHRISLHLLRNFPDGVHDLIAERLTKKALFDDPGFQHEYAKLLDTCFAGLSEQEQEVILRWVEQGPDLDVFKKKQEELRGDRPADEEAQHYRKRWQAKRLSWFKRSLPEKWKKRYEELTAETGEPEHPEFLNYPTSGVGATWVGPTSPKDANQIKKMTVTNIVEFLRVWEPAGDPMNPSPEGLGRVLAPVISEDPARFSIEAIRFIGLHPTYVRAFISGLKGR